MIARRPASSMASRLPRLTFLVCALGALRGSHEAQVQSTSDCTLFAALSSRVTYLIDASGAIAHTWQSELPAAGPVELLENGHLLRAARVRTNPVFYGGGQGGRIQQLDWEGKVVWDFELASEHYLLHHGFETTPAGTVLLLAWERKSKDEALAAGRDPAGLPSGVLWSEVVLEVEPQLPAAGRILWEWHAWDHLVQDRFPERANHGDVRAHPELVDLNADVRAQAPEDPGELAEMRAIGYAGSEPDGAAPRPVPATRAGDWIHANAIDYDPESDRILLCSRGLSELWVIDHSTTTREAAGHAGGRRGRGGDLLARFGNPQNFGAGTEEDQRLFYPHDAHWIPYGFPGYGDVLVFNNGPDPIRGRASAVLELALFKIEGESEGSSPPAPQASAVEPVWSCTELGGETFFSGLLSGAQRLTNGNTLITIGVEGKLVEVTPAGEIVWQYQHTPRVGEIVRPAGEPALADDTPRGPGHPSIFRAIRLPHDFPGLAQLGKEEEGNRPR